MITLVLTIFNMITIYDRRQAKSIFSTLVLTMPENGSLIE